MKWGTKDGSGNHNGNCFNHGNGGNRNRLHEVVKTETEKMRGGKGSGAGRRNPRKMSIRKFIEKSIDAVAFFFTASLTAIAVVATIILIGCIL